MAGFPVGKNDRVWTKLADDFGQREFILPRWLHVGVGHAERATVADSEDLGGAGGLFGAGVGSAAGAHLSGGKIEDAGLVALLGHFQQRAAASEFDVVGV